MTALHPIFLVGAAKAGTTSLARHIGAHRAVAELAIKEPGHYCTDLHAYEFSAAYKRLIDWDEDAYFAEQSLASRHLAFVHDPRHYKKLIAQAQLSNTGASYFLDASTAYLYSEKAAENIAKAYPQGKIIIILRNPAERAYSHYNMACKYGMEKRPLAQAMADEMKLVRARWGIDECYVELGKYAEAVQRYLDKFDRSNILVLLQEDLNDRPEEVLAEVAKFLHLEPFTDAREENANKAEVPNNAFSARIAGALSGQIRNRIPSGLKKMGKRLLFNAPDPLDAEVRSTLVAYFAQDIEKLESLLNIDLNHWK